MGFEPTPGVSVKRITHHKRDGKDTRVESIFVFDLSKMTPATALCDPNASDQPISEWTMDQLFRVMLDPAEPRRGYSEWQHKEYVAEFRPRAVQNMTYAINGNPFNDEAIRYAARYTSEGGIITSIRSTYSKPDTPGVVENTVLKISTDAVLLDLPSVTHPLRDDLFRPKEPRAGFLAYVFEFRRLRLVPLQALIAKNDADVRKVVAAMAYVQQINVALKFAEDFSLNDRRAVWSDFFDEGRPSRPRYLLMTDQELEKLFLEGEEFCRQNLNHVQIAKIHEFQKKQIDPLIEQLGRAALWASAGEVPGVKACKSAQARDLEANKLLHYLRNDDMLLSALDDWESLNASERNIFGDLLEDLFHAFSRCPGATASLLEHEFFAVARGAAGVEVAGEDLPQESSRQKQLTDAVSRFDPNKELSGYANSLTDVIKRAFARYSKTRAIAPPIVALWAHSTPAILARFDKRTVDRVNPEGTAYLLRSVFGMGLLTKAEMQALYADIDAVVESALEHGPTAKQTQQRLDRLFEVDLSHGRYPVRSNSWRDGRVFESIKLAVGLLGIRQAYVAAADEGRLTADHFIQFSGSVLTATGALRGLGPVLEDILGAGKSAVGHSPSFLGLASKLPTLARVTALVSLISSYQAVGRTPAVSLKRDHANADLAVAWLSLVIVIYETALATTFPVAGLALILLRWALFDQDLWNWVGGVESAAPMVKVVHGILAAIENEKGEIGTLLRQAPNWGEIETTITRLRFDSPTEVRKEDAEKYDLYFHIKTSHDAIVEQYANRSYGLADEIAELLVED